MEERAEDATRDRAADRQKAGPRREVRSRGGPARPGGRAQVRGPAPPTRWHSDCHRIITVLVREYYHCDHRAKPGIRPSSICSLRPYGRRERTRVRTEL